MARTLLEELEAVVETERLRSAIRDRIEEALDALRNLAESVAAAVEAGESATAAVDEWSEAEDRESKAEAREAAMAELGTFLEALQELPEELLAMAVAEMLA